MVKAATTQCLGARHALDWRNKRAPTCDNLNPTSGKSPARFMCHNCMPPARLSAHRSDEIYLQRLQSSLDLLPAGLSASGPFASVAPGVIVFSYAQVRAVPGRQLPFVWLPAFLEPSEKPSRVSAERHVFVLLRSGPALVLLVPDTAVETRDHPERLNQ